MATRIPTRSRNAAADAVVSLLDAGITFGYIEIRDGTQPASAQDAATGNVLATVYLPDPAFAAASGGVATANAIATVTGDAAGTAGWFRAYDSDDASVIDGSITPTSGGGDMELNSTAITNGVDVVVTSWTITMPAA